MTDMTPEADEALTPEPAFDIKTLIAEVTERVNAEEASDTAPVEGEDGPSDEEGELSDEAPEGEEEAEDAAEDEEVEEGEAEEETEEEDPETEVTDSPETQKISQLEDLVLQGQQQVQVLLELVNKQSAALAQPKPKEKSEPLVSEDLARMVLFDGDPAKLEKLDPTTRAKGRKFTEEYVTRESRYAVDPGKRYTEQIRELVLADIQSYLKPLVVEQTDRKAADVYEKYASDLKPHKQRLAEVFKSMPGSRSQDWNALEETFKWAADFVRLELKDKNLSVRERKLAASERQKAANKKAAGRREKRGSGKAPKAKHKGWDRSISLFDYSQRLANDGE